LNVVVGQGSAIFKLLSRKDQPLLIRRDSFLVLDLGLNIFNRVTWLNLKGDGLPSESFDKDLHATSQTKNQMKGGLLLDVVIRKGPTILKLLSSKDQSLLIRRDSFFVLNLSFDVLDGVARLNLKGDGFTSESFDKDLHATSQPED